MRTCCKCKAQYTLNDVRSFHTVPFDPELRKKWLDILGIPDATLKFLYVCSDHFDKKSFYDRDAGQYQKKLYAGALPIANSPLNKSEHNTINTDINKLDGNKLMKEGENEETIVGINKVDILFNQSDITHNHSDIAERKDSNEKFPNERPNVVENNAETSIVLSNDDEGESLHQELRIKEEYNGTKTGNSAKRKVPLKRNRGKKIKFSDDQHISFLSRKDFVSSSAWNKFVRYEERQTKHRIDENRKRLTKIKQIINSKKDLKVCRICLATDCKMYLISEHKLIESYQLITGLQVKENDRLPKMLCVECAHRLANYYKFREKCLRANKLMLELLEDEDDDLKLSTIRNIGRTSPKLISDLKSQVSYDSGLNEFVDVKVERSPVTLEEDDLLLTDDKVKKEDEEFNEITQDNIFELDIPTADDTNDKKLDNDETNFNSDYSPDYDDSDNKDTTNEIITEKLIAKTPKLKRKKVATNQKTNVGNKGRNNNKTDNKMVEKSKNTRPRNDGTFGGTFSVKVFTHEEQLEEVRKRQETDNYRTSKYKCDKCFRGFAGRNVFEKHMLKHTDANGTMECDVCLFRFKTHCQLRKHVYMHKQRYDCNLCGDFSTTDRVFASNHSKQHKGYRYTCRHCDEVFSFSTTYFNHLRIKHPSDFICQLCGYSFISQKGVLAHQKLSHDLDGTKPQIPLDGPSCDTCNIRFASTDAYDTHLKISAKHSATDQSSGVSSKVNVYYPKGVTPKYHRKSRNAPVTCEQCGEVLPTGRAYYFHFKVHHPGKNRTRFAGEPIMCEVCGCLFKGTANLKQHMSVHSGIQYTCDLCGKVFRIKSALKVHMGVHLQTKPRSQCNLCGKYFSHISNMRRHVLRHSAIKPYKCDICPKAFINNTEKLSHTAHAHLNEPYPPRRRRTVGLRRRTRQDADPAHTNN